MSFIGSLTFLRGTCGLTELGWGARLEERPPARWDGAGCCSCFGF